VPRSVYATIQDLRRTGLSDTSLYSDENLTYFLELASDIVEAVTGQFFGPRRLTLRESSRGFRSVEEPHKNKIIEVERVAHLHRDGSITAIDPRAYAIMDRRIRLRHFDTDPQTLDRAFRAHLTPRFSHDDENVEVVGIFGWLEPSEKFETTLSVSLLRGAVLLDVEAPGDIEQDDLLLIDGRFWVIVTADPVEAVSPPTSINIDPSPKSADTGASVVRYGKVPRLVREAVVRTAVARRFAPGSEEEIALDQARRMKREETDNYEYELFAGQGNTRSGSGTGDSIADGYLSRFRVPIQGAWA
jgi:hypothetical protein